MSKYERKIIGKDFEKKHEQKKIRNFSGIFSGFVEKTVLIKKIVLFLGFRKPH